MKISFQTSALFAIVAASTQTFSQAVASSGSSSRTVMEEVVVTARHKAEGLQSTPVAVTAMTTESLELAQISDVADLQRGAPNVALATGSPATSTFIFASIRGQQNLSPGVAADPAVGMYIDGVYIARPSAGLFDLSDVERVEVLRGPQGTLFGRNTIGGAINIISAKPEDDFRARLSAEAGNYGYMRYTGMLNLPINDDLAVRLVAHRKERDGYGQNLTLDQDVYNIEGDDMLRLNARWDISEHWTAEFSTDWNEITDNGQLTGLGGWDSSGPGALPVPLYAAFGIDLDPYLHTDDNWYVTYGSDATNESPEYVPYDFMDTYGASFTLTGEVSAVTFTSITAWRSSVSHAFQDLDGTPEDILWTLSGFEADQFSQEFRLSGGKDAFSWIAGIYYMYEDGVEYSDFQAFGFAEAATVPGQTYFGEVSLNYGDVENISAALFFQAYYEITEEVRAVVGYRHTEDERTVVIQNVNIKGDPSSCSVPEPDATGECRQTQSVNFDYPAWTIGLDWQISDDTFIYTKSSSAHMAGGWNLRVGSIPAFEPTKLTDIEIGLKSEWFDSRLRANIAVFAADGENVQRVVGGITEQGQSTSFVQNAGDTETRGIELEIIALPFANTQVNAALGMLDGNYKAGSFTEQQAVNLPIGSTSLEGCTSNGPALTGSFICDVDRSDEDLPQLPELSYNVGVTQFFPLSFGSVAAHIDYAWIGEQSYNGNTPAAQHSEDMKERYRRANELALVEGYGILNASLSLDLEASEFTIKLWGQNLTDEQYKTRVFSDVYIPLGVSLDYVGQPRTYGVTASINF